MTFLQRLRDLAGDSSDRFGECRNCGATVDIGRTACPECESTEIARYDL
jgi:uncharacterized OB-fold protein